MNCIKSRIAPMFVLLCLSTSALAIPFNMTFTGIPEASTAYTEDGMRAGSSTIIAYQFYDFRIGNILGQNGNHSTLFIEQIDGSPFDLFSVDVGTGFGNGVNYEIIGDLFGGGTVTAILPTVFDFVTFAPTDFRNITRVTFQSVQDYKIIDNVIGDTEPANVVPVPATLALFGLGLVGLGWNRRKKA